MNWIAVFIGGGLGSICRYAIAISGKQWLGDFPLHTLAANFFASFILGCIIAYMATMPNKPSFLNAFLAIGFCGGFSTFSTFSAENFQLLQNGQIGLALLYIGLSFGLCLLAIGMGFWLIKSI